VKGHIASSGISSEASLISLPHSLMRGRFFRYYVASATSPAF
jgi:hypothetical protein